MSLMTTVHRLRLHREATEEGIRCPTDDWVFPPRYTAGRCPLCGWVADGWAQPRDEGFGSWFLGVVVLAIAVSAIVLWLTLSVYGRP